MDNVLPRIKGIEVHRHETQEAVGDGAVPLWQRCESRVRGEALSRGGQDARAHGRGRVQARRPRADLLKYISDAFQERSDAIKKEPNEPERDEYMGHNVFWVPPEARRGRLQAAAKSPETGKVIDNAMGRNGLSFPEPQRPRLERIRHRDSSR